MKVTPLAHAIRVLRHGYSAGRLWGIIAIAFGILTFACVHPQYPHALLFVYDFFPALLAIVVDSTITIYVLLKLGDRIASYWIGGLCMILLMQTVFFFVGGLLDYANSQNQLAWEVSNPDAITISLVTPTLAGISRTPVSDGAFTGRNFFGYTYDGWSFTHGNEHLSVVPKSGFRFGFRGVVPVLYPAWTGDFLIHANGLVEDLTAEQAVHDDRLRGVPLYPPELVASLWSGYDGDKMWPRLAIPTGSPMDPILLETSTARYWAIPMYADGKYSFNEFLAVDVHTGKVSIARFRGQSPASSADAIFPVYSDGAWQPGDFLIVNNVSRQAYLVSSTTP